MLVAAARMGLGHRTVAVPTCASPLVFIIRLGSSRPNRLPTTRIARATVMAAATTMIRGQRRRVGQRVEIGQPGQPRVSMAPAIVSPDPRMTCPTPWNAV